MDKLHTHYGQIAYLGASSHVYGAMDHDGAIDYDCDVPNKTTGDIDEVDADFAMRQHAESQPTLFSLDELFIPDTVRNIRKAVSAIHAVPTKAEFNHTLNSRRLFDGLILAAQLQFKALGREEVERIKTQRISPIFEVRIGDLAKLAGSPHKNYDRLYGELDRIFEMVLKWNILGEDAEVVWDMKSHFLASLGYGKGHKRGFVRFTMEPSIMAIVLEPRTWATLSLQGRSNLSTPSSYALYETTWRYIGTQAKVTAALPIEVWIQLLVGQSRYVKEDPNGGKRAVNYGDFKRRVLLEAMARVNETPALGYTLELKEILSGKRVAKLQFKFIPKKQASLDLPMGWPDDGLKVLAHIGLSAAEIQDLSQAHSYEEVAESLTRLKAADTKMRIAGKPIASRKAYFLGILANVADGATADDMDMSKIDAEALAQEAARVAEARAERAAAAFAKHQADAFIDAVFTMAEQEREDIFWQFVQSPEGLKAKPLLAKGWIRGNVGALALLRLWFSTAKPEAYIALLPKPEDRDYGAWMAWRLDAL